ncbi:MAG TPA: hypothetical protein VL547_04795 [Dinghuibacter sp.]|uniref:glycoside hydrolase family 65 protein n=1 Tax=Dinghuibacter sp. TaxID=2024697 RepID=UPI002C02EC9B|nr:glycoside hydrolase family 65 protein [Dinghuibacter sp.]HTJ11314.1 hypothetical protein [Dinghuibacter sp.]
MRHRTLLLCLFVSLGARAQWTITATSRDNYDAPALANGMIGILPSAVPFRCQKVLLNGVYDRYGTWGDKIANIVQGINFFNLGVLVDGDSVKDGADWSQVLNMKEASLTTHFVYAGKLDVTYTLYALRQLPYNGLMTVRFQALKDADVSVASVFTGSASARIVRTGFSMIEKIPLAWATAVSPTGKVQLAAASGFSFAADEPAVGPGTDSNGCKFSVRLRAGQTFSFAVHAATCSSVHFPDPYNESKRLMLASRLQNVDLLVMRHHEAWGRLWESDIQLEGDPQAQRDIRYALFNLYSFVREGTAYGLSPMGLSGTGYNGHVFWDCETWMFPVLLVMHPDIARSLLEYRVRRLGAARQNALSNGYQGAMFPWESADDGTEETPVWALTGPFEQHISSDIGMACWNYYRVTHDLAWLREKGYPVIRGVADFWLSRVEKNAKGEYDINNVVCADEYAENVDNNAFTNGGAIVVLRAAASAARALGERPDPHWETVAAHIPIRYFADSVVREHDTYTGVTIKQADANLLFYPLGLLTSPRLARLNLDYYEPRVDKKDGPAMTYGIFSIIRSRLGEPERALAYFNQAYKPNLRPPFGVMAETPTENNPYFATGAGGMLQAVLYGFAGLDISDKGVVQLPTRLPTAWKRLTVTVEGKRFSVSALPSRRPILPGE